MARKEREGGERRAVDLGKGKLTIGGTEGRARLQRLLGALVPPGSASCQAFA